METQANLKHLFLYLFLSFSSFFVAKAQDANEQMLGVLNQQVLLINEIDKLFYPEYIKLMKLNRQMYDYYQGKSAAIPTYTSNFVFPQAQYEKVMGQRELLPEAYQLGFSANIDSLKKSGETIGMYLKKMEKYLQSGQYQKDKMKQGLLTLDTLARQMRSYLVKHEQVHSFLRTSWHTAYIQGHQDRVNAIVEQMRRILSVVHVVYLDLGWDPAYEDANKHLKEANHLMEELKSFAKNEEKIYNSYHFQNFVRNLDENYFANFGQKMTPEFYQKMNEVFIKDLNTNIIPSFNQFITTMNFKAILASTEPPFMNTLLPEFPKEEPKKDETVVISLPEIPKDTPLVAPKPKEKPKKDSVIVTFPPLPPSKTNLLEGYAANNLCFLIDVSGSMRGGGRLDTFKSAFRYILNELRAEDKISLITYSGTARLALPPTSAKEKTKILNTINGLVSEGKSNLSEGLETAYFIMKEAKIAGGNNRIVIVTDGYLPISPAIKKRVQVQAATGLTFSIFLFGSESDNHIDIEGLREITTVGSGNLDVITRAGARQAMIKEVQAVKK